MKSKKKLSRKRVLKSRGDIGSGMIFVVILVLIAGAVAFTLIGGQLPQLNDSQVGSPVAVNTPAPKTAENDLQLITFQGSTITPTPPAAATNGCASSTFNTEAEILVGSDPAPGAVTSGLIRVWVTDELPPLLSPNEVVDSNGNPSGGDHNIKDIGSDGKGNYLWEPTLYVVPAKGALPPGPFCDVNTSGCIPRFPITIKGDYNSNLAFTRNNFTVLNGPAIDDYTNFKNGPVFANNPSGHQDGQILEYTSEYTWNVTTFGLTTGTYWAQFVIHDGDPLATVNGKGNGTDLGISCITIQIP